MNALNEVLVVDITSGDRHFFARRRTAVRLYKRKLNHNFGKVLTTFQQI